ncbi:MAG: hypothetical protein ACOCP8_04745 [archaeon]
MWLTSDELSIFELVFENTELLQETNWGNYKPKILSFYHSNLKNLKHFCKVFNYFDLGLAEKIYSKRSFDRYILLLKKLSLINDDMELTTFGKKYKYLLKKNNNKIINEIRNSNDSSSISNRVYMQLEFFLFLTVTRCIEDEEVFNKENISSSLYREPIFNLRYFFSNILDVINENPDYNVLNFISNLFEPNKFDNMYMIQAINFTGYEIKRFLNLKEKDRNIFIKSLDKVLNNVPENDYIFLEDGSKYELNDLELKYKNIFRYFIDNYQFDLRFRTKYAFLCYSIFNSLNEKNMQIKLIRNSEINKLISYEKLKDIFENFGLSKIYELVYFKQVDDLQDKHIDFYKLNNKDDFKKDCLTIVEEVKSEKVEDFLKKNISLNDEIIIIDDENKVITNKTYIINNISFDKEKNLIEINLVENEFINVKKMNEYIMGGV